MASDALNQAGKFKFKNLDIITTLISGFVGVQAAIRFKIWYEHFRKYEIHINSYLDTGSMDYDYNKLSPNEKLIFIISLCYVAKIKFLDSGNFKILDNLCGLFKEYNVEVEHKLMGLNNAFTFEMVTKKKLFQCNEFFELFTEIMEILKNGR